MSENPTPEAVAAIVKGLGVNARQVIRSLGAEYQRAPRSQSRQLTASVTQRHGDLIEREWQDGCAQCTYYRLTADGFAVRQALTGEPK